MLKYVKILSCIYIKKLNNILINVTKKTQKMFILNNYNSKKHFILIIIYFKTFKKYHNKQLL